MGYYNIYAVVLIPAAKLAQASAWLNKQGLGTDVFSREIILKTDADDYPARGYAGILRVDIAGYDTLRKAIEGAANCYLFGSQKKATAGQEALDRIDELGYRLKPKGA